MEKLTLTERGTVMEITVTTKGPNNFGASLGKVNVCGATMVQAIGDLALSHLDTLGIKVVPATEGGGFYAGPSKNMYGPSKSAAIGTFIVVHGKKHGFTIKHINAFEVWPPANTTR